MKSIAKGTSLAVQVADGASKGERDMERSKFSGKTILVVEPDISSALDVQDCLAAHGARILTAYHLPRALQLASCVRLSGAIIGDDGDSEHRAALCRVLSEREVPIVLHQIPSDNNPIGNSATASNVTAVLADLLDATGRQGLGGRQGWGA